MNSTPDITPKEEIMDAMEELEYRIRHKRSRWPKKTYIILIALVVIGLLGGLIVRLDTEPKAAPVLKSVMQ